LRFIIIKPLEKLQKPGRKEEKQFAIYIYINAEYAKKYIQNMQNMQRICIEKYRICKEICRICIEICRIIEI
jgi:hypothetical protein